MSCTLVASGESECTPGVKGLGLSVGLRRSGCTAAEALGKSKLSCIMGKLSAAEPLSRSAMSQSGFTPGPSAMGKSPIPSFVDAELEADALLEDSESKVDSYELSRELELLLTRPSASEGGP